MAESILLLAAAALTIALLGTMITESILGLIDIIKRSRREES
jgi:hypothetical protein